MFEGTKPTFLPESKLLTFILGDDRGEGISGVTLYALLRATGLGEALRLLQSQEGGKAAGHWEHRRRQDV